VPSRGASAELECPAGSYAAASESSSCTATPPDTYATGAATKPTPCPSGTSSAAGACSCSAPSTGAQTTTGGGQQGGGTTTGGAGTEHALTVKVAPAKHPPSLLRARSPRYRLYCSVASNLLVRVGAVLRAPRGHKVVIAAPARTLSCAAERWTEATASFKLTKGAHQLLAARGAGVSLTVRAYATGSAGTGLLATATVHGRPWRLAGRGPRGTPEARSRETGAGVGYWRLFGAWRSLVARTVRVGEVPGSNPGAPIKSHRFRTRESPYIEGGVLSNGGLVRVGSLVFAVSVTAKRPHKRRCGGRFAVGLPTARSRHQQRVHHAAFTGYHSR
jgi:hypothetical protein